MQTDAEAYPRPLTPTERQLVEWVLPPGARGYAPYREFISSASVIGPGRRGVGEVILGTPGDAPDHGSPLPPVVSFGVAEADGDEVTVTVREILEGQMSVEVVGRRTDRVAPDARIERRWTYAEWRPGAPCPQCGGAPREVEVARRAAGAAPVVLAICPRDRRVWVRDGESGLCRPVPVTNFHNELMIQKQLRDPAIALTSARLFEAPGDFADADIAAAFVRYNRIRTKVDLPSPAAAPAARGGVLGRLAALIRSFGKIPQR